MNWSTLWTRRDLARFHLCYLSGPIEIPAVNFGEGDISTELETNRQRRSRTARISRRLVPLERSASNLKDFSGRDHSQTLLEKAFDAGMSHLKWGNSKWRFTAVPQFRCLVSDLFFADPAITPINAAGH